GPDQILHPVGRKAGAAADTVAFVEQLRPAPRIVHDVHIVTDDGDQEVLGAVLTRVRRRRLEQAYRLLLVPREMLREGQEREALGMKPCQAVALAELDRAPGMGAAEVPSQRPEVPKHQPVQSEDLRPTVAYTRSRQKRRLGFFAAPRNSHQLMAGLTHHEIGHLDTPEPLLARQRDAAAVAVDRRVEAALRECRVRDSSERADDELRPAGSLRRLQGGVVLPAAQVDAPEREVQISAQKMEPRQLRDEPGSFR